MLPQVELAIIGGSGLESLEGLQILEVVPRDDLKGPFGLPSDGITIGEIGGRKVAFLRRHGVGHLINPTNVPYRANIWALVQLGVRKVYAVSACGSLTEDIQPGRLTVPAQLINYTFKRPRTFFDRDGLVVHISVAKPFCEKARQELLSALIEATLWHYNGGTYITIEGPPFSSNAEHDAYIKMGCHIIGMTTSPEAHLAREAGMCYAVITMPTDIYTTGGKHQAVTAKRVEKTFKANITKVLKFLPILIANAKVKECSCWHALKKAIQSDTDLMPAEERTILNGLLREERFLPKTAPDKIRVGAVPGYLEESKP